MLSSLTWVFLTCCSKSKPCGFQLPKSKVQSLEVLANVKRHVVCLFVSSVHSSNSFNQGPRWDLKCRPSPQTDLFKWALLPLRSLSTWLKLIEEAGGRALGITMKHEGMSACDPKHDCRILYTMAPRVPWCVGGNSSSCDLTVRTERSAFSSGRNYYFTLVLM